MEDFQQLISFLYLQNNISENQHIIISLYLQNNNIYSWEAFKNNYLKRRRYVKKSISLRDIGYLM